MSDSTRTHRPPSRGGTTEPAAPPPGAHPAETEGVTTRFGHTPGRTPEDSVWRAYEDDLRAADAAMRAADAVMGDDYFGAPDHDDGGEDDAHARSSGRDRADGLGDALIRQGRVVGGSVLEAARRNPVGTALTAAGVALLFAPRMERDEVRAAARTARMRAETAALRGRTRARARMAPHERRLREGAHEARDRVERVGDRLGQRLESFTDRIEEGTEEMTSEARNRVVAARIRAIAAQDRARAAAARAQRRADHAVREGADSARDAYREHPLLVGTLAVALGAAIGASLPRTRFEDTRLGEVSERLKEEAEDIYRQERARLAGAARGAMHEAREMASETAEAARHNIPDGEEAAREAEHRVREGAARVAEGVQSGARRGSGG